MRRMPRPDPRRKPKTGCECRISSRCSGKEEGQPRSPPAPYLTLLCGLDPDCFDVEVLFHLLDAGFTAVAAHLVAAERHSRVHRLVAVDPHRAGAQPLGEAVRLRHVAGPNAAAEPELGGVAAGAGSA